MTYEDQAFMDYCDRLTWRHAAQYLRFLIAYPMAIVMPNPNYQEDF